MDRGRKIDVFPHIVPPRFYQRLLDLAPAYASTPNLRSKPALYDLDARFRIMDRYPGYAQVLTLPNIPAETSTDVDLRRELAQAVNDELAELVEAHPSRFVGFAASVSLLDVDSALREVERAVHELGALGVEIQSNVNGHPLDEERFEPFFAIMAALGKPIWVHPSRGPGMADYASEPASRYGLNVLLGWPYETAAFMARLVFSGIMDRYPTLKVITHHGGGIVPHLAGRLVLTAETPAHRANAGFAADVTPEQIAAAFKRFYGDTVFGGAVHPLECALSYFGTDHILFGTDMPFGAEAGELFVRETIASIERRPTSEERHQIFHGNAETVLGLSRATGTCSCSDD